MAVRLFVDTWGWLTLHDKSERYHQQATHTYQQAIAPTEELLRSAFLEMFGEPYLTKKQQSNPPLSKGG